jgi:hypothetical protein
MKKITYILILLLISMLYGCREDEITGFDKFNIKNSLKQKIYYETDGYSFGKKTGEIGINEKEYIGELASHSTLGLRLFEIKIYTNSSKTELLYSYFENKVPLESGDEDGLTFNMTEDKIIK